MTPREDILQRTTEFYGSWAEDHSRLATLLLEVALDIRDQLATITERIGGDGLTSAGTVIGTLQDIEEAVCSGGEDDDLCVTETRKASEAPPCPYCHRHNCDCCTGDYRCCEPEDRCRRHR